MPKCREYTYLRKLQAQQESNDKEKKRSTVTNVSFIVSFAAKFHLVAPYVSPLVQSVLFSALFTANAGSLLDLILPYT